MAPMVLACDLNSGRAVCVCVHASVHTTWLVPLLWCSVMCSFAADHHENEPNLLFTSH